jgi:3-dehydroquinate dehydratase/shikimate dehydrogenase
MTKATLIATLTTPPSQGGEELSNIPESVEWLEARSDLSGELDADWLRGRFPGRLLYSLRGVAEGGDFGGSREERLERLRRAARSYDMVELSCETDCANGLLDEIPVEKRLVTWRGRAASLSELRAEFERVSATPAKFYKLVTRADKCGEEFAPLSLLDALRRDDTVAYSEGPFGFWTRLMAPRLGAPLVFGLVQGGPIIADDPTVNRLIADYGLPQMPPVEGVYGIVGNPVFHSLSPRLHNAAYRLLGYPALFVPFYAETFGEFWREVVEGDLLKSLGMPVKGLTVASPHKEAALLIEGAVSPMARRAESANIIVRRNGSWKADTTDPEVVLMARRERGVEMSRKRAAVIGCGGAGRAIATALAQEDAGVTLVNRGAERGHYASEILGLPCEPLSGFSAEGYDIVVNATPVGRDDGGSPFEVETLGEEAVVIDLVYGSRPTPLIKGAAALARKAIDGRAVLMAQVLRQFHLMTGEEMPASLVSELLGVEAEPLDLIAAG